jgi:isoquinoline 1-oxidoreductase alpha subunit
VAAGFPAATFLRANPSREREAGDLWAPRETGYHGGFAEEDAINRDTGATKEARMAKLTINGQTHDIKINPDTPLLWAIRENVGLTGTKYGCGIAQCGACTVHLDGQPVRSCSLPVSAAEGKQITTIEGLAQNGVLSKVQQAWVDNDVPQCGYCQSGMIMAVSALLKDKPKPTDADINRAITNICRCGTFQQVREAIHAAAASA